MFDLQPPRHISTLRISPVAAHSGDRLLSEPTAGTQPCRRERLFLPHTCRSQDPPGSAHLGGLLTFPNGSGCRGWHIKDVEADRYTLIGYPVFVTRSEWRTQPPHVARCDRCQALRCNEAVFRDALRLAQFVRKRARKDGTRENASCRAAVSVPSIRTTPPAVGNGNSRRGKLGQSKW